MQMNILYTWFPFSFNFSSKASACAFVFSKIGDLPPMCSYISCAVLSRLLEINFAKRKRKGKQKGKAKAKKEAGTKAKRKSKRKAKDSKRAKLKGELKGEAKRETTRKDIGKPNRELE